MLNPPQERHVPIGPVVRVLRRDLLCKWGQIPFRRLLFTCIIFTSIIFTSVIFTSIIFTSVILNPPQERHVPIGPVVRVLRRELCKGG
jgi:hypothetical protein